MKLGPFSRRAANHNAFGKMLMVTACVCCNAAPPLWADHPGGGNPSAAASGNVKLDAVDQADLEKIVAQHPGELVLVDFWATWCSSCRQQFPHTVMLANRFRGRGLTVYSLSMDDRSSDQDIKEFLTAQKARFGHLIRAREIDDAFEDFQIDAVPCYRVYGADGKLLHTFAGDANPEQIAQFIAGQIAKLNQR
jgi:thiol-disulfide isomerase/thioredoxin